MAPRKKAAVAANPAARLRTDVSPWQGEDAAQIDRDYIQMLIDCGHKPDPQWIVDTLAKHLDEMPDPKKLARLEDELAEKDAAIDDLYDDDDMAQEKQELREKIAKRIRQLIGRPLRDVYAGLDDLCDRLENDNDTDPACDPDKAKIDPSKVAKT